MKGPNYIMNPDQEQVNKIRKAIEKIKEQTGIGYCPCVLPKMRTEDSVCPCKNYRTTGHCCCKLYVNENIEE